jgi:hypothetical protein
MMAPQTPVIQPASSSVRKPGRRWHMDLLALARWAWMVVALLLAGNFVASIPAYYTILRTVCTLPAAQCGWRTTPANMVALARLHIPVETYVVYFITLDVTASLLFWIVGLLIYWRKSHEWMGLLFSLVLIINGSSGIADTLQGTFLPPNAHAPLLLAFLLLLLNLIQWPALGTFLVTFPTGHFAPRWSWVIVLLWIVQLGFFWLAAYVVPVLANLILVVVLATYGSTFGIQVYRYMRVYDAVQRQQVKWCIYAFFIGLALEIGSGVVGGLIAPLNAPDSWYQLLNGTFTVLLFVPIPLAIGIAIFRYHLWDIDIIINRTLVYGSLTAMLALVYFGLVFALQSLVQALSGQNSQPIIIVASTLVVAALFQPMRRRIQAIIDRRFYRSKYDATRILAAFGATLRSEVDLETLSKRLVAVVHETMQPAHVSLWLLQPRKHEKRSEEILTE